MTNKINVNNMSYMSFSLVQSKVLNVGGGRVTIF